MNRGFIPKNADLSPAFNRGVPAIMQKPVVFHDWQEQFVKATPYTTPTDVNLNEVKLDVTVKVCF